MDKATLTKAVRVKLRTYKVKLYVGRVFVGEYEVEAYDQADASEKAWGFAECDFHAETEVIENE